MQSKNSTRLFIIGLATILFIAACSPKPQPDTPAEDISSQPEDSVPGAAALGDCYNPFNPVTEGKTWTYSIQTGDTTEIYRSSYKDVTNTSFISVHDFPDVSTSIEWSCSPDGLLSSDLASMNITQIDNVNFDTVEVVGVIFPPEELWQIGYIWDVVFKVKISITIEDTTLEGEGEIALKNSIAAIEPVSVPAGSYPEAYRVDASGNFKFITLGVETNIPTTYSTWYVKNVGMVKSSSKDQEFAYLTELVEFE